MRTLALALIVTCFALPSSPAPSGLRAAPGPQRSEAASAQGQDYAELRAQAEARFAEGSYQLALELYQRAAALELDPQERAWVAFRSADASWRAAAQSKDPDTSTLDAARSALERELQRYERPEQRDDLYAQIHESLGDLSWRRGNQDWGGAWSHYSEALSWWAGSSDLERARARYLGICWRAALPPWREEYWGRSYFPTFLPQEVVENVLRLARGGPQEPQAHYLLARTWMSHGYDRASSERIRRELEAVLAAGRASDWYDDALFALGLYLESTGRFERDANGNWSAQPDYAGALEQYRRLLSEFKKGETAFFDEASAHVRQITRPALDARVERYFLPGSEVSYALGWRNVASIELSLVPVDLTGGLDFNGNSDWFNSFDLDARAPAARWTHATGDDEQHRPGRAELTLEQKPASGAYVLRARAAGLEARALVLVSDAAVNLKVSGRKLLAWATDVSSGAPLPEADLLLLERWYDNGWHRREQSAQSGADGLALFELANPGSGGQFYVGLKSGARQAFAQGGVPGRLSADQEWRLYVHGDRATYRPGQAVHWALWARTRSGEAYATPSGERLRWEVRDPQGTLAGQGEVRLDEFGGGQGTLETTATMTLGEYRMRFLRPVDDSEVYLGEETLFRLEEYELPEYEVRVARPQSPDGKPVQYRLGDRVEVEIEAGYYYGAPVADATVEVFVHQRPRYRALRREREFPWYYEDQTQERWWGGPGQQVLHQTLRSDPAGRCRVAFDTPADAQGEFEYTIEARVTDASRREIVGSGSVVVARQGYDVEARVAHAIHAPGARVELEFLARDPDGNPVSDDGTLEIVRQNWVEIWVDPSGKKVTGDALEALRADLAAFPPDAAPGVPTWRLEFRGYERERVARVELRTDAEGRARHAFTPEAIGTYQAVWSSLDDREVPVTATASFYVADGKTTRLGYLPGGIEILVDQDTVRVGQEAAVLLVAPTNGRWVLFTVENEELLQYQVLQLSGQVKLLRIPIEERFVPNVYLSALALWGGTAWQDSEELIVPPVEQFLSVEVQSDPSELQPGQEGHLTVRLQDHAGRPVAGAFSLTLVDEALAYVQEDYAMDPRRFFYGQKRAHMVSTAGSFQHGRYSLLEKEGDVLRDLRSAQEKDENGFFLGQLERQAAFKSGERAQGGDVQARLGAPVLAPASESAAQADQLGAAPPGPGGGPGTAGAVRVRSDFRETALWLPQVVTDASGQVSVPVSYPDSVTRWRASVRACDRATRVGQGTTTVKTRLPLIARLQAPRFFVVGDELVLSANLNNNLTEPLTVQVALTAEGLELLGRLVEGEPTPGEATPLVVPALGQVRVDWRVAVREPGRAVLRLAAIGEEYADAVERTLPVYPHGIEAFLNLAGKLEGGELALQLDLPAARRADSTSLEVSIAPSLAVTLLDALPYLADYPYGCVEQTLSRFLPAVIVARTLSDAGLSAEEAMARSFGGIEPGSAAATHPQGKRALERLDEMTRQGLERLYDFQHADGSWAWWKSGDGNSFMSAYVLWGLTLAREAGIEVRASVLENGARWLAAELVDAERDPDLQAWILHALATYGGVGREADARRFQAAAFDGLIQKREALNAYGRALLALSAKAMGKESEARLLVDNLRNGALIDRSPDTSILQVGGGTHRPYTLATAHWGNDGIWHRWAEGGVEATACVLRALLAIAPEDELVQPTMNWLVKNRRGAQWSNTRDTALCVLALSDYLETSGELGSAVEYELAVNGTVVATRRLEPEQLLAAPGTFDVDPRLLHDGANEIRIARRQGQGPLYFAARARFFSQEEPLPARGNEVFVRREYYRMAARPTLLQGTRFERVLLRDGDLLTSGERVEVVLTAEAKNDLEYLVFEDLKPAGLEAVQVRSGEPVSARELRRDEARARFAGDDEREAEQRRSGTARDTRVEVTVGEGYTGRARAAHQELRDRQVAFFLDRLPQGTWELRYELRAETPGLFHALPTLAHAMYVPEIRGNGEELRLRVQDR